MNARRSRYGAWAAAAAGLIVTVWLFYPGFATYDTAAQWYQVRHGAYDNHHPPLMALLWSLIEPVIPGPGGPFLVQAVLYWAALGLLAGALFSTAIAQVCAVLIAGFAPPLFGLLVHVWKDVALMAWLMFAGAVLVLERQRPDGHRGLLMLATLAIVVAAALRHNGLAAALPLTLWVAWRALGSPLARRTRTLLVGIGAFALVVVLAHLPERLPQVKQVQFWPTLALWDLAAVSIAEDRILIPGELQKRPLTLADLRAHFDPSVNVPLFAPDLIRVSLVEPYSTRELERLRNAWLALPLSYPGSYLAHRWRLARALIGWPAGTMRPPQDVMPGHATVGDNPPIHVPGWSGRNTAIAALRALSGTPVMAAWPWLLASLPLALMLWRRRRSTLAPLGLTVLGSAWCYAFPLAIFAASAELRYLSWTLAGIAIAAAIAIADRGNPQTPGDR